MQWVASRGGPATAGQLSAFMPDHYFTSLPSVFCGPNVVGRGAKKLRKNEGLKRGICTKAGDESCAAREPTWSLEDSKEDTLLRLEYC
jgi:hypothetical protein